MSRLIMSCLLAVVFAVSSPLAAEEPFRAAADRPIDVLHSRLELEVLLKEKRLRGAATIDFSPLRELRQFALDAVNHDVAAVYSVDADGKARATLPYENTGESLIITYPTPVAAGRRQRVHIEYEVQEPEAGLHFFQPTEDEPNVPLMAWTQGESTFNRYWFPCIDHPNERQTTELIAVVDNGFEVLSNGRLLSRAVSPDCKRVRYHWSQEKSHVAYLVTLVVGQFAVVEEQWRGKPVLYYVPPERKDDARRTFGRTREMLDLFSGRFGIEYPWEKYAQVVVEQFIAGGMENTSATTLHEGVMHDERALLDSTPDWLIAHELGHQWWGDLVTCKDWSHLWLNEGFATFCEVLWAEHHLGRDEHDYRLYQKSRAARSGRAKTRPVVDRRYANAGIMFDSRAYPKGCWVLCMLRRQLGDGDFFRVLELYGKRFAYQTAETTDLRRAFEEYTGRSLERFFYDWTERPGHPQLVVKTAYHADDRLVRIELEQTQEAETFHFPLKIELAFDGDQRPVTLERFVKEKTSVLFIPVPRRPELVRIDPEFALLADLKEEKSRDWWAAQLAEAPTVAERIRAVEHFAESKSAADRELLVRALPEDPFYGVRVEAAKALGKSGGDASRDALLAGLRQSDARVRRACAEVLGSFDDDKQVEHALVAHIEQGDRSYATEAALLESLAKVQRDVVTEPLLAALEKPSHREVIRQAALKGLGRSREDGALDVLLVWTGRGKPRECRTAAVRALAVHLNRSEVSPVRRQFVLETLTSLLKDGSRHVRQAAVDALKDLGPTARPARDALESLARHDPYGRVRSAAEEAIEAIDAEAPSTAELTRLREEVDKLRRANSALEERLKKLEAN